MTPIDNLHRIASEQGIGIRRSGDDRFDLVNRDDDAVIARQLTLTEVNAFLKGDFFEAR